MTTDDNDREMWHGVPRVKGRFVKGKSGNPHGRPKKPKPPKSAADPKVIDDFLRSADALVKFLDGGKEVQTSLRNAVDRAQVVSALNGNPHSQKAYQQRDAEMRQKRAEEIAENRQFWRKYVDGFDKLTAKYRDDKTTPIESFPHPEELIFPKDGFVTGWAGGDPWEAAQTRITLCKLRDALLLQAEKDRRHYGSETLCASGFLAFSINRVLPERLVLDEVRLFIQMSRNRTLNKRELQRQLNIAWDDLGLPKACGELITPPMVSVVHRLGLSIPKAT